MADKEKISSEIDSNNDHILQSKELDTFVDILEKPKRRERLIKELDEDKEFQSWFGPEVEKFIKKLIESGKTDQRSIRAIQFYIQKIGKQNPNLKIDGINSPETKKIIEQLKKLLNINPKQKEDTASKTAQPESHESEQGPFVDSLTIANGDEFSFVNPETQQKETYKISDLGVKENKDRLDILSKKDRQLLLVAETGNVYRDYLQNIKNKITFDLGGKKDERYQKQIGVIDGQIVKINTALLRINGEKSEDIDTKTIVDDIFISEKDIAQTPILLEPFFDWGDGRVFDPRDRTQYVNNNYERIKSILLDSTSEFTQEDIKRKKVEIFKLFRINDGMDDNMHEYDSGMGIQKNLEPDILNDEELNKKQELKKPFDFVKSLQNSPQKKQELFESARQGKEGLKKFLEANGFENPEKDSFLDKLYDFINETLNIITKEIEKQEKEGKVKFKSEAQKKTIIDNQLIEATTTVFSKFVINSTLEQNKDYVKQLGKNNQFIDLYSNIEGIGDNMSDQTFNKISGRTKFWATQIAMMYVAGVVQLATRLAVGSALAVDGLTAGTASMGMGEFLMSKALLIGVGTEATLLGAEGAAFYKTYDILNGIMNEKDASQVIQRFKTSDWYRTSMFLGVLRALPLEKFYNQAEKLSLSSPVPKAFCEQLYKMSLDTAGLLSTDIAIKLSFGEGVPNPITNVGDFFNFIQNELSYIIPLVAGLRGAEGTVGAIGGLEKLGEMKNKELDIVVNKDGTVTVEGLRLDIRKLKQSLNILDQKKKTPSVVNEKKEVRQDLTAKKQQLKEEKEFPPAEHREMPKGYKPRPTDSMREDASWTIAYKNLGINLDNIKLEDVVKGFGIDSIDINGNSVGKGFQQLYSRISDFKSMDELQSVSEKTIDSEFQKLLDYLGNIEGLNEKQLEQIRKFKNNVETTKTRIKQEFIEAVSKKIAKQNFDKTYGNPKFMEKIMDLLVKKMRPELIDSIIKNRMGRDNDSIESQM